MIIRKTSIFLGAIAGISSILLWIVLNFYNPYSNQTETDVQINTFFMLFLPACLAIIASITTKKYLMLLAFVWSLPISSYLILTPGIFSLFGITCLTYMTSFLFMKLSKSKNVVEQ